MKSRKLRILAVASLIALPAVWHSAIIGAEEPERLIIKCPRPCAAAVATVAALGGETTQTYDNVDAVAVSVPRSRVGDLTIVLGVDAVRKDVVVMLPPSRPVEADAFLEARELEGDALTEFVSAQPDNYNYNNGLTGATTLHAAGMQGQNVIVGLIDSGTALFTGALGPLTNPTVIGGENFVPITQDPVASATSRLNDWHGTGTADMIAAHANFGFATASRLAQSLLLNAPGSAINCPNAAFPGCLLGTTVIPMVGTAPAAKIYALKVFPSRGGGAPESRIIAAMDRAITLRRNFNSGAPSLPVAGTGTENDPFRYDSLNLKVVNMSLGGPTLFAGGDIEDELTLEMLEVGITLVTSAGNDGFAAMTGGSPGTGIGSLTTGASNTPVHERILRDIQFAMLPVGIGALYRPSNEVQTAYFSSRGPTADGRFDPDVSANGFASYVNVFAAVVNGQIASCGAPNAPTSGPNACASRILFVSGTSFASPTVAGAAALLRGAAPSASALQVRNALIRGANPTLIGDGSGRIDQGAGFLDVPAALALLNSGMIEDELPTREKADDRDDDPDDVGAGGKSVTGNLRKLGIRPVKFVKDTFTSDVKDLKPGQVAHFFVPSDILTDRLVVKITSIVRELPPEDQNLLFGDDLFVMGVDAPTSFAVHRIGIPTGSEGAFVNTDSTFVIDNPQTGLVRLGLQGDWTNAGRISATLTIERERRPPNVPSAIGQIRQGDLIPFYVNVPAAAQAVFELFWLQNWGRYPTNDLDMFVVDPGGNLVLDTAGTPPGASSNSPERAVIANPVAGQWTVVVDGFSIQQHGHPGGRDDKDLFTLTVTADGRPLKVNK
jgi:hypothetical protein